MRDRVGYWSVTLTLHLWWLLAYLAVGLVVWLPLEWVAHTRVHPRPPFWRTLRKAWKRIPIAIALWPACVWEVVR